MERTIGYLGSLLRQPSNPFRNLAAQTKRVANTNALVAMWPDFEKTKGNPRGSIDLGGGYLLLGPKDTTLYCVSPTKRTSLDDFFSRLDADSIDRQAVYRWGRLRIPTGQIARSRWKELERCSDMAQTDRNIKVCSSITRLTYTKHTTDLISRRHSFRRSQILFLQDVRRQVTSLCPRVIILAT